MAGKRREVDDLAALIEQGLNRGLDVIDAFWAVSGPGRGTSRALAREQRKALEAHRRIVRKHERTVARRRRSMTTGAVIAGGAGSIGVLDLALEAGGNAGAFGPAWLWFGCAGVGAFIALRSRTKLRAIGSAPMPIHAVPPPQPIPRSAIGAMEVQRLITVRMQILHMANTVAPLSPEASQELRDADTQAAAPLGALAERLGLLHQLRQELPGSTAAEAAHSSALVVQERLASGCETYEELLAAAARLLAAPDAERSTADILQPAVTAMIAYAHGLQTAYDTFEE